MTKPCRRSCFSLRTNNICCDSLVLRAKTTHVCCIVFLTAYVKCKTIRFSKHLKTQFPNYHQRSNTVNETNFPLADTVSLPQALAIRIRFNFYKSHSRWKNSPKKVMSVAEKMGHVQSQGDEQNTYQHWFTFPTLSNMNWTIYQTFGWHVGLWPCSTLIIHNTSEGRKDARGCIVWKRMSVRVNILLNHSAAASLSITGPSRVRSWISSVHGALIASTAAVCHVFPAASALQYNQSITAKVQCHTLLKTPFCLSQCGKYPMK